MERLLYRSAINNIFPDHGMNYQILQESSHTFAKNMVDTCV